MKVGIRSLLLIVAVVVAVITVLVAPAQDARDAQNMTLPEAALLGTIEGISEFLPISSTGHLLVAQRLMEIGTADAEAKRAADAFAICIQLGAILAVLGLYAARIRQMANGLLGRSREGLRLSGAVALAFAPAAALGLLVGDQVKEHLFGPWPVVLAWALGGAAILAVAWIKHESTEEGRAGLSLEAITWRMALLVGLVQCVAMWPGVSRSLVTIVGGVLAGLSLVAAVEFSFLLGVVTLGAATAYDAVHHGDALAEAYSPPALVVGLTCAFVSATLAVRWLVGYLREHGLQLFGWYRLGAAVVVAALLLAEAL